MTVNEVLKTARGFIADPENWLVGERINYRGAYCALGAIDAAAGANHVINWEAVKALSAVIDDDIPYDRHNEYSPVGLAAARDHLWEHGHRVAAHNNTRGHQCTLEAFDRAIEATK